MADIFAVYAYFCLYFYFIYLQKYVNVYFVLESRQPYAYFLIKMSYICSMKSSKLSKYNLSLTQIAEMFGYSSVESFRNSSAYKKRIKSVEQVITHVEKEIIKRIER